MKRAIFVVLLGCALPVMAVEQVVEQTVTATVTADDTGDGAVVQVVAVGDPGAAGNAGKKYKVMTRVAGVEDENRGWLGVALGETHTKTSDGDVVEETQGITVMNVVKGSPAEQAGLLEGDLVLSLNGIEIEKVNDLAKAIGDLGPGSIANFVVERDGVTVNVSATLTSPQTGNVEWLYTPEMSLMEHTKVMPHVWRWRQGGGGPHTMQIDELNLDDLDSSMSIVAKVLGSLDDATTELSFEEGKKTIHIRVDRDGELLDIEQSDGGPIIVTRTIDSEETTNEYADEAALEAGDPDAFELFNQHQPSAIWIGKNGQGAFDMDFTFGPGDEAGAEAIRKRIQLQLESFENLGDRMEDITAKIEGLGDLNIDIDKSGMPKVFVHKIKASRSFKVNPEGQIELIIRKGDTEIVKVFHDEADLEARDPAAFNRYREVMDADIE